MSGSDAGQEPESPVPANRPSTPNSPDDLPGGPQNGPADIEPVVAPIYDPEPPEAPARPPRDWKSRALTIALLLLALVVIYLIAEAFIPRWWANRVGHSVNGQLSTGALLGFSFGVVFTLLPLGLLWMTMRRYQSWKLMALWLLLALILAAPNLMTLGVSIGSGSASHAGQRTMDVLAPMFRGATLVGALLAIVVFVTVVVVFRRKLRRAEAEVKAEIAAQAAPPSDAPPETRPPE
ncbi:MAG: permease [Catenulispora sp.]|nr:permease [Catenulispora sp.]